MRDIATKVTGSTLTADEFNDIPSEIENCITDSGQALATVTPDLHQLSKAAANYAGAGDFFNDTGSANSYVLAAIGSRQLPTEYFDGMRVRFLADNANTGGSTLAIGSLGARTIRKFSNSSLATLVAGDIYAGMLVEAQYRSAFNDFVLTGVGSASTTREGTVERANQSEVNAGTDVSKYVTPQTLAGLIGGGIFPAGTRMAFHQAAAPPGWTQDASLNDRMLRVVSGSGGGNGGSWTLSGMTVGDTALTTAQLPSHNHINGIGVTIPELTPYGYNSTGGLSSSGTQWYSNGKIGYTSDTGSGATHTHSISGGSSWRPLYTNIIICQKD